MMTHDVQNWFWENGRRLSQTFSITRYHTADMDDQLSGAVSIQVDAPSIAASISLWNKGNVEVLVLDKRTNKNYAMDDRKLAANEDIKSLLDSYFGKITELMREKNGTA